MQQFFYIRFLVRKGSHFGGCLSRKVNNMINKEDKVTNTNMPYRNLTSKEYINKIKNGEI